MEKEVYFDLHCDTLTRNFSFEEPNKDTLNCSDNVIALKKLPEGRLFNQFFAVFVPDTYRGEDAERFFFANADNFIRQCDKFSSVVTRCKNYEEIKNAHEKGQNTAILTIESGAAFGGKIENIEKAREKGVCACTITWNGKNELASGNVTSEGFSSFGKEAVRKMEEADIIADVSHLNDKGFYELLDFAHRPFIATHSNSRKMAGHLRNLKDDQIKEMINMKSLIGLNFFIEFLNDDKDKASLEDIYRHAYHILDLGGEDILALGSDFDGCVPPKDLDTLEKSFSLADFFMEKGFGKEITEKIMGKNAMRFMKEYFSHEI